MVTNKKFKDTRTGEIVTQFNILDSKYMEEVKDEDIEVVYEDDEKIEIKIPDKCWEEVKEEKE